MTTPNASISVNRRGLGVATSSGGDILAVLGPATSGDYDKAFSMGSSSNIRSKFTRGPMVQLACFVREAVVKSQPLGRPIVCVRCKTSTPGAVGDVDLASFTGTAVPATVVTTADDDYQLGVIFDVGCTVGTAGGVYRVTKDGGLSFGPKTALGVLSTIEIPESGGVLFDLNPPDDEVTALIAFAVEARSDTLAHLADLTSHASADTSSAQVALAASSAPTTAAQAWAVLNLCRAALEAHRTNLTVHKGPDYVDAISHAAATNASTGVDLAIEYHEDFNAHLALALAASAAGLKAATATVASPVTLTATDLLSAGVDVLDAHPRRLTFTTAGATASDAPATVDISGTVNNVAQTESGLALSQTAGSVTSTKAWDGTGLTITYPAADGTGATIAIGYEKGGHTTADATNTISSTDPAQGTIVAKDVFWADTTAPAPSDSDLDDALQALQTTKLRWDLVALTPPVASAGTVGVITDRVSQWEAAKKYRPVLCNFRLPNAGEDAADYRVAWKARFDAVNCDAMNVGYDGCIARSRIDKLARYRRPAIWGYAALAIAAPPGEDLAWVDNGLGAIPDVTILDDDGNPLFHDEDSDPGPDDDRAVTLRTVPGYSGTFVNNPRTLAQPGTDLWLLQYYRAVAKSVACAHLTFTGQLSMKLEPDTQTGLLAKHEVEKLQGVSDQDQLRDVITPGWAVESKAALDNTVNLFQTPLIPIEISIVPYLYAKGFSITIGLKNPFAKTAGA